MNPFLDPPDQATRQVIDAVATSSDPSSGRPKVDSAGLVPAAVTVWPPPPRPVAAPTRRWPRTALQRYTAALLAVLTLGGFAALAGLAPSDSGDVLDSLGAYITVLGLAVAGAMVSIVLGGGRMTSRGEADQTDELLFRIVFAALAALVLVVVLQSDTQNVVNADGQTASLWAVIGGFSERLARRFVADASRPAADR